MELSIFIAKIIAILYISAGVGVVSEKISFKKLFKDMENSPLGTFMAGVFAVIIGMLLIEHHNIWVKDWPVIITMIGWIALVKGALFIAFPQLLGFFKGSFKNQTVWGVIIILIGLLFGFFGFIPY